MMDIKELQRLGSEAKMTQRRARKERALQLNNRGYAKSYIAESLALSVRTIERYFYENSNAAY
jgi:DNA-binding NarL/FixJ family response regulator